jgi:hypothetical protein
MRDFLRSMGYVLRCKGKGRELRMAACGLGFTADLRIAGGAKLLCHIDERNIYLQDEILTGKYACEWA